MRPQQNHPSVVEYERAAYRTREEYEGLKRRGWPQDQMIRLSWAIREQERRRAAARNEGIPKVVLDDIDARFANRKPPTANKPTQETL